MAVFQMICFIKDTIQSAMGILCGKKVPHVAAFRGIAPGEGGTTTRGPVATISKVRRMESCASVLTTVSSNVTCAHIAKLRLMRKDLLRRREADPEIVLITQW